SPTMKARRLHEKMLEHAPMPEAVPAGKSGSQPEMRHSALLPDFVETERPPLRMLREEPPAAMSKTAIRRDPVPPAAEAPARLALSRESVPQEIEALYSAKLRKEGL